jgi:hypothetical protein
MVIDKGNEVGVFTVGVEGEISSMLGGFIDWGVTSRCIRDFPSDALPVSR